MYFNNHENHEIHGNFLVLATLGVIYHLALAWKIQFDVKFDLNWSYAPSGWQPLFMSVHWPRKKTPASVVKSYIAVRDVNSGQHPKKQLQYIVWWHLHVGITTFKSNTGQFVGSFYLLYNTCQFVGYLVLQYRNWCNLVPSTINHYSWDDRLFSLLGNPDSKASKESDFSCFFESPKVARNKKPSRPLLDIIRIQKLFGTREFMFHKLQKFCTPCGSNGIY